MHVKYMPQCGLQEKNSIHDARFLNPELVEGDERRIRRNLLKIYREKCILEMTNALYR